jgi:hypothetical protein
MPAVIIDDTNYQQFVNPTVDGEMKSQGLIPRNFGSNPTGCLAAAPGFPDELLIQPDQQQAALDLQQVNNSSGLDLRNAYYDVLKSLDQDGYGLCWAFSSTKADMYTRARMGLPPVRLSAWAVAGWVKGWRDQGGWNLQSIQMLTQRGAPEYSLCPKYDSSYDNTTMRANAELHKITEWYDGDGSQNSSKRVQQMISMFLLGMFPALDYNWWGHSVCGCRLVSINPLVIDIDNSWGESAGDRGIYTLKGSKAVPDALACPKLIVPSRN